MHDRVMRGGSLIDGSDGLIHSDDVAIGDGRITPRD